MKRHLLNAVTCLSSLLLGATMVLWLRSHRHAGGDTIEVHRGAHRVAVSSCDGCLAVAYARAPDLAGKAFSEVQWEVPTSRFPPAPSDGLMADMGFRRGTCSVGRPLPVLGNLRYLGRMYTSSVPAHYVQLPWWPIVLLTMILPTAQLARAARRRRRARRGLCPECGYDLRASPGRCPECGAGASIAVVNV